MDIQQHNGDAGGVLFQQAQAVLAGSRFGSVELAVQHLAEQHPVHGRVVHNEHTLAAVGGLQGVRLRLTLGDHGVFLDACIVHQPFRVLHRIVHIFVVDPHAANAGRHADAGVARHAGRLQLQTDLFQTRAELFLPDVRQQQKQPAAVVADQAVFFFRKAAPDGAYRRFQHAVARTGAVNIVGELQIVHIQHRHTGGNAAVAVIFIVIGAVVGTGQRVAVALFPLVGNAVEQPLTVFRVQQNAAVDLAGQLQHTELAIHLHTAGRDLVQLLPKVFQPCFPGVLFQRLPCHAVFTRTAAPPLGIAGRAALLPPCTSSAFIRRTVMNTLRSWRISSSICWRVLSFLLIIAYPPLQNRAFWAARHSFTNNIILFFTRIRQSSPLAARSAECVVLIL